MTRLVWLTGTALGAFVAFPAAAQESPIATPVTTQAAATQATAQASQSGDLAAAQQGSSAAPVDPSATPSGDIIVTARRRAETSFDTPVVLQAVGAEELQRRAIVSVEGLSRITPLFILGESSGSVAGAPLSIRGIGGSDINPFADQPIAFNIDGVQVTRSSVARIGTLDLASAEILKGPQALFFGKNSPGGVITLTSADPTPQFDARISMGYEFNAHELRTEGFVSGPVTSNLGVRVAGLFSGMDGYIRNDAVPIPGLFPVKSFSNGPRGSEYAGRITFLWQPSSAFTLRLKGNYAGANDTGHTSTIQIIGCGVPGVPQFASIRAGCTADGQTSILDPGPRYNALVPTADNGDIFSNRRQVLTSAEATWRPTDHVALTSVTGYYNYFIDSVSNVSGIDTPTFFIGLAEKARFTDFTQEFRGLTTFRGPVNFSGGLLYQRSTALYDDKPYYNVGATFTPLNVVRNRQRGQTYSAYGQVILTPGSGFEISGGGRFTRENKSVFTSLRGLEQVSLRPRVGFSNFSPEATVKWSASQDLNLFASYRTGFLSGGFNGGAQANYTILDLTYGPQTTRGFEAGFKARLFNRSLRVNFSVFDYDLRGLQVSSTQNNVVIQSNAGRAYSRGAEIDANWVTPLRGLTLRGALSYDRARYQEFTFSCWKGQSIAQGCNLAPNAAGIFTLQSLAGGQIVRAPEWGASAGFNFEQPIGDLRVGFSADGNYSGSYYNSTFNEPLAFQRSYWLLDASARLGNVDNRWQVAVIGRNLTNRYYVTRASEQPFSGGVSGTAIANRQADALGAVNRGREIMLQLTLRPGAFARR